MTTAVQQLRCWAELADDRPPYQSPQWYTAAGWLPRTRLLTAGPAAVPVWTLHRDRGPHYFHDPVELVTGRREEPFLRDDRELAAAVRRATADASVLLTMSPYGYRGGALGGRHASPADLAELVARMLDHARAAGASIVASHYLFDEDDDAWLTALTEAGGLRLVTGADAVLDVAWPDLAGYWHWLGQSRRSLRRGRNIPDGRLDWEVTEAAGLPEPQRGIPELLRGYATRFDPVAPAPAALFQELADGYTLPRTVLSVREPGRPARSAAVVLRRADTLYAKFFGSGDPRADYLPLAYPRLISYAIDRGFRRIEYGGGSHQAKLMRGARLRPCWGVLFVLDQRLRADIEALAVRVSTRKQAYFADLVQSWQVATLPVNPAFAGSGLHGSSPGGSQ
ncbi:hypothetical protein [Polymorphospora lycopeni]|uniref:BioF2-like acetyltransferase domain-containing protein n=1 Tax=Polymorphospora lycopeni TaxID=3140240 RepID=A0ABV5CKB6_9ACTN